MKSFEENLANSIRVYKRIVIPKIEELRWLGANVKIERIEGQDFPGAEILDKYACIDYIVKQPYNLPFFISTRAEFSRNYRNFTICKERPNCKNVEFYKLKKGIDENSLRPKYLFHAFVIEDRLRSMAMAKAEDVLDMILRGKCDLKENRFFPGTWFYRVSWNAMEKAEIKFNRLELSKDSSKVEYLRSCL